MLSSPEMTGLKGDPFRANTVLNFFWRSMGVFIISNKAIGLNSRSHAFRRRRDAPSGLRYAFTLHDPDGNRLLGFDNAHGVSRFKAREPEHDHWHRSEKDEGRPYRFIDADTLLADFETEVARVLKERGVAYSVIAVDEIKKGGRS